MKPASITLRIEQLTRDFHRLNDGRLDDGFYRAKSSETEASLVAVAVKISRAYLRRSLLFAAGNNSGDNLRLSPRPFEGHSPPNEAGAVGPPPGKDALAGASSRPFDPA